MSKIAFCGGLLFSAINEQTIENALVLLDDKTITYAGPMTEYGTEYETIDISGCTIMPGLIDSHLHFSGNLTDNDSDWVLEHPIQKTICAVAQARESLESGLTTVGEISRSGLHIRNMVAKGIIPGPRIVGTGLGFCRTAGHGDSHLLPSYYNEESHPWAERVDGPWALRKAVRQRLRENPDAIKIWSTGGGIWRLDRKADPHYTYEEIAAVVEECNMVGLPVWSHAEGYQGASDSCKAGVWAIIHGQELSDECIDIMAEKNIYFCPTIQFLDEWFQVYTPPYRPIHDQYPGATVIEKETARIYDNLRKAHAKGVVITVGSDSFCSSLTPYGKTAIHEMYVLCRAGLSNAQVLLAATKNGAQMLKVDDITGTLEKGKYADIIVLRGNPLQDIKTVATENMVYILKEGQMIKRPR